MTLSVISLLEDIRPSESIPGGFPQPLQGNKVCRYVSSEIGLIAFARLLWEPSSLPPPCKLISFSVSLFLSLFSFFLSSRLFPVVLPSLSRSLSLSFRSSFFHGEDLDGASYANRSFRFFRKSLSFMHSMSSPLEIQASVMLRDDTTILSNVRDPNIPSYLERTSRGRNLEFSTVFSSA